MKIDIQDLENYINNIDTQSEIEDLSKRYCLKVLQEFVLAEYDKQDKLNNNQIEND